MKLQSFKKLVRHERRYIKDEAEIAAFTSRYFPPVAATVSPLAKRIMKALRVTSRC